MEREKQIKELYKMLGDYDLSGTETFKDHLNDLSSKTIIAILAVIASILN